MGVPAIAVYAAEGDPETVVSTVSTALATMGPQLLGVAAVGLGIGVSILALRKGWGLVKRFF